MTISRLIFIGLFWFTLFLVHTLVYALLWRVYGFEMPYWYLLTAFLAGTYILARMIVQMFPGKFADRMYFAATTWLGVIFILFSATIGYEIVRMVIGQDVPMLFTVFLGAGIVASMYALIQGARTVVKKHEIPVQGLSKPFRIVHLSDVHIGTVHQTSYLQRIVELSNKQNPDVVLMTGDLFDGSAPIHEEMLQSLDDLGAPSFFSMGNHEEYEGLQHVRTTIKNLEMRLLDSAVVEVGGVQIIGVNDRQSIPRDITLDSILEKLSLDPEKPKVLMYHTPVEWESAQKHGIDLMLSGHTHNGQIWPFTLLVRMSFKYINGLYKNTGKYLHVSPGTGTWGPPMRLGSKNQVTVLELIPA